MQFCIVGYGRLGFEIELGKRKEDCRIFSGLSPSVARATEIVLPSLAYCPGLSRATEGESILLAFRPGLALATSSRFLVTHLSLDRQVYATWPNLHFWKVFHGPYCLYTFRYKYPSIWTNFLRLFIVFQLHIKFILFCEIQEQDSTRNSFISILLSSNRVLENINDPWIQNFWVLNSLRNGLSHWALREVDFKCSTSTRTGCSWYSTWKRRLV